MAYVHKWPCQKSGGFSAFHEGLRQSGGNGVDILAEELNVDHGGWTESGLLGKGEIVSRAAGGPADHRKNAVRYRMPTPVYGRLLLSYFFLSRERASASSCLR